MGLYHEKLEWFFDENNYFKPKYMGFKKTAAADFYRDIFPEGSFQTEQGQDYSADGKGNGFLVYKTADDKMHTRMVFDNLVEIFNSLNFDTCFMSPISYFGRNRTSANARELFALVFDLDNVGEKELDNLFGWYFGRDVRPVPTYIVVSGAGIHLYYVFEEPVPLYPNIQKQLKKLKYAMTDLLWNEDTSQLEKKQFQGINQGFRLVGSGTKEGGTVLAFRTGEKVTLEYLSRYVSPDDRITDTLYHPQMTLEQAKKKYPEWYHQRIELGRSKKNWTCKRDLYDWWKKRVVEAKVHHRYFYVMSLACYAIKCGISEQELRQDAYSFLGILNDKGRKDNNSFTENDLESALEMYQECYRTFPRSDIEKITGIEIPKNKRNGRTQRQHLQLARFIQEEINQNYHWRNTDGRPPLKNVVLNFLKENPNARKCDVIRGTGLDKKTVYKYYDECLKSLGQ